MRAGRIVVVVIGALAALSATYACTTFDAETTKDPDGGGAAETGGDVATSDAVVDAAPPRGPSCKAILKDHPERAGKDGVYPLVRDGGPESAYCDMTIDDGGWTLVGRSAPNAVSTDFGWNKSTGDVDRLEYPYSLGVIASGIVFEEVLVAERAANGGVGSIAFRFQVKSDFVKQLNAVVDVRPTVYVRGPCNPDSGPLMFRYAGSTGNNNNFFLRDIPDPATRNGLDPSGFDLAGSECAKSATLDGKQGVVFVR